MSCHIISYNVMSYPAMSCYTISCQIFSCLIMYMSCHEMSRYIMSCHFIFEVISHVRCHVMPCPSMSYYAVMCHGLTCLVMLHACYVIWYMTWHVTWHGKLWYMTYHIIMLSYHVMSCQMLFWSCHVMSTNISCHAMSCYMSCHIVLCYVMLSYHFSYVFWCDMMWCDILWHDTWHNMAYDMTYGTYIYIYNMTHYNYDITWHITYVTWYGMAWNVTWHDMIHEMTAKQMTSNTFSLIGNILKLSGRHGVSCGKYWHFNIREYIREDIIECILFQFPGKNNNTIIRDFCIMQAKYFIYQKRI